MVQSTDNKGIPDLKEALRKLDLKGLLALQNILAQEALTLLLEAEDTKSKLNLISIPKLELPKTETSLLMPRATK